MRLAELIQNKELPGAKGGSSAAQVAALISTVPQATQEAAAAPSITAQHLNDLHVLLVGAQSHLAGFRIEQNWIGGSDHHPLDAEFVPPPPDQASPLIVPPQPGRVWPVAGHYRPGCPVRGLLRRGLR